MSKSTKYMLIFLVAAGLVLMFMIKPDGKYFTPFAHLVKKKAEHKEDKRSHTLDLEKYRPKLPNN